MIGIQVKLTSHPLYYLYQDLQTGFFCPVIFSNSQLFIFIILIEMRNIPYLSIYISAVRYTRVLSVLVIARAYCSVMKFLLVLIGCYQNFHYLVQSHVVQLEYVSVDEMYDTESIYYSIYNLARNTKEVVPACLEITETDLTCHYCLRLVKTTLMLYSLTMRRLSESRKRNEASKDFLPGLYDP